MFISRICHIHKQVILQDFQGRRRASREFLDILIGSDRAFQMAMNMTDDQIEALTERIIGCAIEVHKTLGPGLLEAVYRECLILELRGSCLGVEVDWHVRLDYKGQRVRRHY